MSKNKEELLALAKKDVAAKDSENKDKKECEVPENKHLTVLHLLFELDFKGLNNALMDDFFDPNSLEMLDDKIEVLTALKNGKKQDEIPKFYDVLEYLNDCDSCNQYEDELCETDEEKPDECFETESAEEIEKYFKKAMKTLKKDLKVLKKAQAKKKAKRKNKDKKEKNSKKLKKDKKNKKDKKDKKNKKDKKDKKNKKNKK